MTISNTGKGPAHGVEVAADPLRTEHLRYFGHHLRTLDAGEEVQVEIPVSADLDVADGEASLQFGAQTSGGFSAVPVVLAFGTQALLPVGLSVSDIGYRDSNNGLIEPGELVDVTVRVHNSGPGRAEGVQAILHKGDNVFFAAGSSSMFSLGDMDPGESRDFEFAIYTNQEATGVPLHADLLEATGRFASEGVELALELDRPARTIETVRITGQRAGMDEFSAEGGDLAVDVDIDIPAAAGTNPDAVAVVIGNRGYSRHNPDVPDVSFAHRDAGVVGRYLVQAFGIRPGNMIEKIDATAADMNSIFGTRDVPGGRLADMVKPGRSDVVVFYSGHGAPLIGENVGCLVPVNCPPGDARINGYRLDVLYRNLALLEARSVTVILDACFSGGSDAGTLITLASPIAITVENPAQLIERGVVFSSSMGDQISSWYPEKGHGLFTYFFLKGLQGAADLDGDHTILAGEMQGYLSDRTTGVPYWARHLHGGRKQEPEMVGDADQILLTIPVSTE